MRLTGIRAYYRPTAPKMPPGLVELMEGLTKEVLKHNPSDVYEFCAGHVEQLLEKRDGPSRKKLSLEEKIRRAQEKVRQRAQNRIQEFDQKILLQEQNDNPNNDVNDEITLQVPQLITPESRDDNAVSDIDNATSIQEEIVQNILKAPIHHEEALENSSEVEISHQLGTPITTPNENFNESGKTGEFDDSNVSIGNVNAQSINEINQNEHDTDILPIKTPDTETTKNHEKDMENKDTCDNAALDLCLRGTNDSIKNVNVISDQELPDCAACINNNIGTDLDTTKDIEKVEENSANIENIETTIKSSDDNRESNNTDSIQAKECQSFDNTSEIQDPRNLEPGNNDIDQTQQSNHAISSEIILPINIDKPEEVKSATNVQNADVQLEHKLDVNQELNNEIAQTKNDADVELYVITTASAADDTTQDLQLENIEHPQLQLNDGKEEISSMHQATSESNPDFNLSSANVDKDIPTLVTPNMANDENEINDLVNTHALDVNPSENRPLFQVDREIAVLDKVTSDSEDVHDNTRLDNEDNSTDAIVNFSSVSTHTEAHNEDNNKDESSDMSNENINNDTNQDPGNMNLETAAITIQKVFRTFLFKSRGSTFEDTGNDEGNFLDEDDKNKEECDFPITSALNIDRRAHGITRMDTVLQTVNEEKSLSLSDDSSTLSSAATIIQAHVRGFLVRNKLNSYKTVSTNSLAASNSNEPSITSLEADNDLNKNKTVLNIHIVPEGEIYLSRDESLITSMELSLDSSPPSSINFHPLGYDKSERRKQLKREDAIQSISPPSNNSGKLSEDVDSVKELSLVDHDNVAQHLIGDSKYMKDDLDNDNANNIPVENGSIETALNIYDEDINNIKNKMDDSERRLVQKGKLVTKISCDEMDVVTPFISNEGSALIHSGEFHDAVLPTRVSRSDTSVVSEFKNVLVYFLLWNHS